MRHHKNNSPNMYKLYRLVQLVDEGVVVACQGSTGNTVVNEKNPVK